MTSEEGKCCPQVQIEAVTFVRVIRRGPVPEIAGISVVSFEGNLLPLRFRAFWFAMPEKHWGFHAPVLPQPSNWIENAFVLKALGIKNAQDGNVSEYIANMERPEIQQLYGRFYYTYSNSSRLRSEWGNGMRKELDLHKNLDVLL